MSWPLIGCFYQYTITELASVCVWCDWYVFMLFSWFSTLVVTSLCHCPFWAEYFWKKCFDVAFFFSLRRYLLLVLDYSFDGRQNEEMIHVHRHHFTSYRLFSANWVTEKKHLDKAEAHAVHKITWNISKNNNKLGSLHSSLHRLRTQSFILLPIKDFDH